MFCSPLPTTLSARRARSGSGPRPTASPTSTISQYGASSDRSRALGGRLASRDAPLSSTCAAPAASDPGAPSRRTMMRKLFLAGICGLMLTPAGIALAASEANMVTGMVQKVDQRSGRVVIDGQTFIMNESGPLALVPQVGHKVALFFDDRNGQKVITRI